MMKNSKPSFKGIEQPSLESRPFAEVIESSLHGWKAQSWQWDGVPPFGSLVTVAAHKRTLLGVVHQVRTGSDDPVRHPFAYQKTHEELLKEQPQIFEFLKTTFDCLVIGYVEGGKVQYTLAPKPAMIHSFVALADDDLSKRFFYTHTYLHVLFSLSHSLFNLDELVLALLQQQSDLGVITERSLQQFIELFSLLMGNDYRRLKLFLQRVELLIDKERAL